MKSYYHREPLAYTGKELRSHFAFRSFGILGDSVVAFAGPCRVNLDEMVDLADVREGAFIESPFMLHFIIEHFDHDLGKGILRQRLFADLVREELRARESSEPERRGGPERRGDALERRGDALERRGDDLFLGDAKLTVSIATLSPVSALIHFGINIRTEGTPVKTAGLEDFRIETEPFARAVMDRYVREMEEVGLALCKVRPVP
jgi:hypothetical protein